MKFEMPKRNEPTLLEQMCIKYGMTLNITERRVLDRMDIGEIEVVVRYELKKARLQCKDHMNSIMQQLDKLDPIATRLENNSHIDAMKVRSKMQDLDRRYDRESAQYEHLDTLLALE